MMITMSWAIYQLLDFNKPFALPVICVCCVVMLRLILRESRVVKLDVDFDVILPLFKGPATIIMAPRIVALQSIHGLDGLPPIGEGLESLEISQAKRTGPDDGGSWGPHLQTIGTRKRSEDPGTDLLMRDDLEHKTPDTAGRYIQLKTVTWGDLSIVVAGAGE